MARSYYGSFRNGIHASNSREMFVLKNILPVSVSVVDDQCSSILRLRGVFIFIL